MSHYKETEGDSNQDFGHHHHAHHHERHHHKAKSQEPMTRQQMIVVMRKRKREEMQKTRDAIKEQREKMAKRKTTFYGVLGLDTIITYDDDPKQMAE